MAVRRPRARGAAAPVVRGVLGGAVTVKGEKATAVQRRTIEACLQTALELGCSRLVMIAVIMCITQESSATPINHGDAAGPDSRGPFQQRGPWGPLADRMDPAAATRLFLTSARGHGLNGWRAVHGSLKNAPSPLSHAINKIQISKYPDAYAQWQSEATRTVDVFLQTATTGPVEDADAGAAAARYDFQAGGDTDWWESTGNLASEVQWSRWAAGNVLHFVSDRELAAQAPALVMDGLEPWVLAPPAYEGGPLRVSEEMTLTVAAGRWPVMPGAVVSWTAEPLVGRWIVASVSRVLGGPEVAVTLRRGRPVLPEPAAQKATPAGGGGDVAPGVADAQRSRMGVKPLGVRYSPPGPHGAARNAFGDTEAADIGCPVGSPVLAVADGVISRVKDTGNYSPNANPNGIHIYLSIPGNRFFYTHMFKKFVSEGQRVQAGQVIATSGAANSVPHLHFEVENGSIKDWV